MKNSEIIENHIKQMYKDDFKGKLTTKESDLRILQDRINSYLKEFKINGELDNEVNVKVTAREWEVYINWYYGDKPIKDDAAIEKMLDINHVIMFPLL